MSKFNKVVYKSAISLPMSTTQGKLIFCYDKDDIVTFIAQGIPFEGYDMALEAYGFIFLTDNEIHPNVKW